MGTWGGGVSRYEEGEWRNLSMVDGLAGNIVYSIAQDESGAYWFGTNRLDSADGLPGNHVYAITVAGNGDVWVGTRDGVARLAARADNE